MKHIFLLLFLYLFAATSFGQTPDTLRFTLVEAITYAVENNLQLKRVQLNEEGNRFKIKELKSSALPQINGTGAATDNFKRGSQLLPGDLMGQPGTTIPVQFGTRFNYGSTVQLSQTIYNPSLRTGLQAAKESQALYQLQTFASKEELVYNLVDAYMQLQMSQKQKKLIEGNLERTAKLREITNEQFKEGIVKKVDVDQIGVNYINLETQLSNTINTISQLLNSIKLLMNVDVEQPIAITGAGTKPLPVTKQLYLNANTELSIAEQQIQLQQLNTENIKASYLPTVSLGANYGRQWQTNELLKSSATTGMSSGSYSLNVSIPLFDGNAKRHKIAQSNIALKQLQLDKESLTKSIKNEFQTALNTLNQNQRVLQAQLQNMRVAEDLYNVARLSYTEGITPLTELINAENSLREAQSQYLTAMLQTNLSELNMMRSSGQLSQLLQGNSSTK